MDNSEYRTGYATQSQDSENAVDFADLKTQLEDLKRELSDIKQFRDDIKYNNGLDNNDIKIDSGRKFITGPALFSGNVFDGATSAVISTSKDKSITDGVDNSQLTIVRLDTGNSVVYSLGGKVIIGDDASYSVGGSRIVSDKFNLVEEDSLIGQYITIQQDDDSLLNLAISANKGNYVTVSTLISSSTKSSYVVYKPVFLGGEEYPWQRLYLHGGLLGGVQFGGGSNGNGANGLLYASGNALYYRNPVGTITQLN
jgi:hypothetical protein